MKTLRQMLVGLLTAAVGASYLRMFSVRLSMRSWQELLGLPAIKWLGALIGAPLFELYYFLPLYALAISSFWLFTVNLRVRQLLPCLILGAVHGLGWYFLGAGVTNSLWRHDEILPLALVYTVAGVLPGWYYYTLVHK